MMFNIFYNLCSIILQIEFLKTCSKKCEKNDRPIGSLNLVVRLSVCPSRPFFSGVVGSIEFKLIPGIKIFHSTVKKSSF